MPAQSTEEMVRVEEPSGRQVWIAACASIFGWSLDLFDLFIILYLAPTIGPLFFPARSPTLSLAGVYGAFAVTLVMRPAGAALFGAYADRHGRRRAMTIAVISVGLGTALMGAVPTIRQIGVAAPILFLLLRLIQGIFVGGVAASALTVGTETVGARWRGLLSGAIAVGAAGLGGLLASGVFLVVSSIFSGPVFAAWGWRVMFFSGILSSVLGLFIFGALEESPLWSQLRRDGKKLERAPLRALFSPRYRLVVLANLAITMGGFSQYYLTLGFLPTFLAVTNHLFRPQLAWILTLANVVIIVTGTLAGHLSEFTGRRRFFLAIGVVNVIALPLLYIMLSTLGASSLGEITLVVLALTIVANVSYAPVPIFLNERFPTAIRATGTAICWNVGAAIAGMTPLFATTMARNLAGIPHSVAFSIAGAVIIFLIGALVVPETRGRLE